MTLPPECPYFVEPALFMLTLLARRPGLPELGEWGRWE
jgi:hypothetical protein